MHTHPDTHTEKRGSIASEDCSFGDRRVTYSLLSLLHSFLLGEVPLESTAELADLSYLNEES